MDKKMKKYELVSGPHLLPLLFLIIGKWVELFSILMPHL